MGLFHMVMTLKRLEDLVAELATNQNPSIRSEIRNANKSIREASTLARSYNDALDNAWILKKFFLQDFYEEIFSNHTTVLEMHEEELLTLGKLNRRAEAKTLTTAAAYWYKHMINDLALRFWKNIGGKEEKVLWAHFITCYQLEFRSNRNLDNDFMDRIRQGAHMAKDDTTLTIGGFILLTNECGFPLDFNKLPPSSTTLSSSHPMVSMRKQMEAAKVIDDLKTLYFSDEMYNAVEAIFGWYEGYNKHDHNAWQKRANKWATIIKRNYDIPIEGLDERGKLAQKVDKSRQIYSFFFQRYMVLAAGNDLKKAFAQAEFPGKRRVKRFIRHVKPLDRANYEIIVGGDPDEWDSKQPMIYKFLEDVFN